MNEDTLALDRFGNPVQVGNEVTFVYDGELHGGTVVYIARPVVAQLVIEFKDQGRMGLDIVRGKSAGRSAPPKVMFDDVIVRTDRE